MHNALQQVIFGQVYNAVDLVIGGVCARDDDDDMLRTALEAVQEAHNDWAENLRAGVPQGPTQPECFAITSNNQAQCYDVRLGAQAFQHLYEALEIAGNSTDPFAAQFKAMVKSLQEQVPDEPNWSIDEHSPKE